MQEAHYLKSDRVALGSEAGKHPSNIHQLSMSPDYLYLPTINTHRLSIPIDHLYPPTINTHRSLHHLSIPTNYQYPPPINTYHFSTLHTYVSSFSSPSSSSISASEQASDFLSFLSIPFRAGHLGCCAHHHPITVTLQK